MAHKMLRSEFLGKTLERGSQLTAPSLPAKQQTQAIFGGGGPKRKTGGGVGRAADQAKRQLSNVAQQAKRQAPKRPPQLPKPKQVFQQAKRAAPRQVPTGGGGGGLFSGADLGKYYGPNRQLFLPDGFYERSDVPDWLDGTRAGDYGFDPIGLGKSPAALEQQTAGEVINGRFAMLAAVGIIVPEALAANGADIKGAVWFETPGVLASGEHLNYFAVPWAIIPNPLDFFTVIAINSALIGGAELFRGRGTGPGGFAPGTGAFDSSVFDGLDNLYPGGIFNPLNVAASGPELEEFKVKEVKNGRLAMSAFLGFLFQWWVTGEGPWANFTKHISDPFANNILTVGGNFEDRIPTL